MATTTTHAAPVIKNLLIKDSRGNAQLIEVIETAPGKFVTTSGHSIKTAPAVSGARTIIRAVPATSAVQTTPGQQIILTTTPSGVTTLTAAAVPQGQAAQIIKTTSGNVNTIFKSSPTRQVMTIPIQPANPGIPTTILKAANIKTEFGSPLSQAAIFQRASPIIGTPVMQQIIQAGNQRLLLTQTANGPQLTPLTSASITQLGQQLTQFITPAPASPSAATVIGASTIGPTLNISKQSFISPILDHTGARKRVDFPSDVSFDSKRRKAEKGGKGLRHFSMKVCEKVRTKGITTYNEVADELVNEFASPSMGLSQIEQQFDQKNIRRRVYDALNVLMAMNIISKEKKEIKWLGLPTNSMQECTTLEKDRQKRIERLKAKTQQLHDLIIQQVAFKSLVERNKAKEKAIGPPLPNGSIHLPFLIVNTNKQTVIDCSISSDKMEYLFNFDGTFEIHDDIEVLKRMGLALGLDKGTCADEDIAKAKLILPKALEDYVDQIGKRSDDWKADFGDLEYDESYFHTGVDGEIDPDNVENIYEVSGHSLNADGVDGLSSLSMCVEDLEMEAAIESLHNESTAIDDDPDLGGEDDVDESFGDDEDGGGISD